MPKTPQSSAHEAPSLAEWRQLHEVATAFRDLAPWDWVEDWEYFGVQDPEILADRAAVPWRGNGL